MNASKTIAVIGGGVAGFFAAITAKTMLPPRHCRTRRSNWAAYVRMGLPAGCGTICSCVPDSTRERRWDELGRKSMNKLIETLTNDVHSIGGKGSFKEESVTCGGISLRSLNANTLESKVCPNLYFAGEVLNVDGVTGGFNLQAAWTTGYVAGISAVK